MPKNNDRDPTCAAAQEVLVEYLDGELPQAAAEQVRSHLAGCPACRRQAGRLDRSLALLVDTWPAIMEAAERHAPQRAARSRVGRPRTWRLTAVAAGTAAAAVALLLLARPGGQEPSGPVVQNSASVGDDPAQEDARPAAIPQPAAAEEIAEFEAVFARLLDLEDLAARQEVSLELLAARPGLETHTAQAAEHLAAMRSEIDQLERTVYAMLERRQTP